jgi:hypothetical protein
MTDALKAAVREAMQEVIYLRFGDDYTDHFTSALARRGVVVATAAEREARIDLVTHKQAWLDVFKKARDVDSVLNKMRGADDDGSYMDHETRALERVVNALGLPSKPSAIVAERGPDNCAQATPSESPAPKPARKVEFTPDHQALLLTLGRIVRAWANDMGPNNYGDDEVMNEAMRPFDPFPGCINETPISQPEDERSAAEAQPGDNQ